jgi:DNA-binding transcriptional ArsR family regulator
MTQTISLAPTAFLIADPTRAEILMALMDGRARPAGELAEAAGVTAQTASSHLGKLLAGGLLVVETRGRHRYYQLSGAHVALALENLALIGPVEGRPRKIPDRQIRELQFARCCYDHLAGRVGVAVTRGLQRRGFLVPVAGRRFEVTPTGAAWFGRMGLDVGQIKPTRRGLALQCLDFTEREYHLAGPLGAQFLDLLCAHRWLRRSKSSSAIQITPRGWAELRAELDVDQRICTAAERDSGRR